MNIEKFKEELGDNVFLHFTREIDRSGRNLTNSISNFSTAKEILERSFSLEYSRDGWEFWQNAIKSLSSGLVNDVPPDETCVQEYTRKPTRKRIKPPVWARVIDKEEQ